MSLSGTKLIVYVQGIGISINQTTEGRGGKMGWNDSVRFKWRETFKKLGLSIVSNLETGIWIGTENITLEWIVYKMFESETNIGMTQWPRSEGVWGKRNHIFKIKFWEF